MSDAELHTEPAVYPSARWTTLPNWVAPGPRTTPQARDASVDTKTHSAGVDRGSADWSAPCSGSGGHR